MGYQKHLYPHFLGVRLSTEQRDFVDSIAQLYAMSASEVVRVLISREQQRLTTYISGKELIDASANE